MDFLCAFSTCIKIDSLTFLHLEYINMLLICINIFFLFSFCLCMNFSFTFFASTFISFSLFSVFFLFGFIYMCRFQYCTWIIEEEKNLMKNNTDSQTTKQTVYYSNFYALFLYRMITEEVCGTTSMVHTHSHSQWYDMNRNEIVCVEFLSFIFRFCRSSLISTEICCSFFSRTISAEKKIFCVRIRTLCEWMGKFEIVWKQTSYIIPFRTKQFTFATVLYFGCY